MTLLTLIAPAIIAPLACLVAVRAIGRAEAGRRASRSAAPAARIVLDAPAVPAAPVAAEPVRERTAA